MDDRGAVGRGRWLRSFLDFVERSDDISNFERCIGDPLDVVPRKEDGGVISSSKEIIDIGVKSKVIGDSNQVIMSTASVSKTMSIDNGKTGHMNKGVVWFPKVSSQKMVIGKGKGKMVHFSTSKPKFIPRPNGKLVIGKDLVGTADQAINEEGNPSTSDEEYLRWAFAFQGPVGGEGLRSKCFNKASGPSKIRDDNRLVEVNGRDKRGGGKFRWAWIRWWNWELLCGHG